MVYTRWSPDSVIQKLQELHKQGTPLRSDGPNFNLYQAARKYFGSWAAALKAAGIPVTSRFPAPRKSYSTIYGSVLRKTLVEASARQTSHCT